MTNARTKSLLAAVILLAGCRPPSAPEQALRGYIRAVREHRCDAAMRFLSARTRHAVRSLIARPYDPRHPAPIKHYYCYDLMFENCKDQKTTVAFDSADAAKVSMPCGRRGDSILPGFSSMFLKYEPRVSELVREDGQWRVELPFAIEAAEVREQEDRARAGIRTEAIEERQTRHRAPIPGPPPPVK